MKPETVYNRSIGMIARIMQMSVVLNINTDYAIFCDFAGHCNMLSVSIGKNKDEYNTKVVDNTNLWLPEKPKSSLLHDFDHAKDKYDHIKKVHDMMKKFCEENEINTDGMKTKVISEYVYEF